MAPCIGSRVNYNYEPIASRVGAQFRTQALESQRHLHPPSVMSNVLTTRPWPVRAKTNWHQLNGITHWTQQRIDSEQEDSPLDCLHLALAFRYYFVWGEGVWEYVYMHWQQRKFQLCANYFTRSRNPVYKIYMHMYICFILDWQCMVLYPW